MKNILIYGDSNTWGFDVTHYIPELDTAQRMTPNERWSGRAAQISGTVITSSKTRSTPVPC